MWMSFCVDHLMKIQLDIGCDWGWKKCLMSNGILANGKPNVWVREDWGMLWAQETFEVEWIDFFGFLYFSKTEAFCGYDFKVNFMQFNAKVLPFSFFIHSFFIESHKQNVIIQNVYVAMWSRSSFSREWKEFPVTAIKDAHSKAHNVIWSHLSA